MENVKKAYLKVDIDEKLKKEFQIKCIQEDITMTEILVDFAKAFIEGKVKYTREGKFQ